MFQRSGHAALGPKNYSQKTVHSPPLHIQILSVPAAPQKASPLFTVIPPELRSQIFSLALADFPDPSADRRYAAETCYTRPSYFAPRKSDARLLRTCRAVYGETWFLPFLLREQTHWLSSRDRAPPEYDTFRSRQHLRQTLAEIAMQQQQQHGQHGGPSFEIESLRVFAQMYMLEADHLVALLQTPYLYPRSLTLTIRHADWWWWETDAALRFEGSWLAGVCRALPSSVREVHIELESLERKKKQVDAIAKQMGEKWFFSRTDGVVLYPDVTGKAVTVERWTGSSTWHGETWTRDETKPGQIEYYVADVVFRPARVVERRGGQVSALAIAAAEKRTFDHEELRLQWKSASSHTTSHYEADFEEFLDDEEDDEEEDEDEEDGEEDDDGEEGE